MSIAEDILDAAEREIGVKEEPMGSNKGKRVRYYQSLTWYNSTGWPWCVAFAWCFVVWHSALKKKNPYPTASVEQLEDWARKHNWDVPITSVRSGDLCCFGGDHVTIYSHGLSGGFFRGLGGNQNNQVQYSNYPLSRITTVVRVPQRVGTPNEAKPPRYEVIKGEGEKAQVVFTGKLGTALQSARNALRAGARTVRIRRRG